MIEQPEIKKSRLAQRSKPYKEARFLGLLSLGFFIRKWFWLILFLLLGIFILFILAASLNWI